MAKPIFRNDDKFQRLPHRDWLREKQPHGNQGYVVEDLDLVLRVYGDNYEADGKGCFMLCELKFHPHSPGYAQRKTFGLVDELLRAADPDKRRYAGYFLIQYDNEDWDLSSFWVNGVSMERDEFLKFTSFDLDILNHIPPYQFR